MISHQELYNLSLKAREKAYCPYSRFATGAALLGESGRIYLGCNVAVFKAVSEGERRFKAIAVCGAPEGEVPDKLCAPCGVCRQVLSEFVGDDFKVIMFDEEKGVKAYPFKKILPFRFDLNEY